MQVLSHCEVGANFLTRLGDHVAERLTKLPIFDCRAICSCLGCVYVLKQTASVFDDNLVVLVGTGRLVLVNRATHLV